MIDRLLRLEEAAAAIGIKKATIEMWLTKKQCPFEVVRLESGSIRVKESVLKDWLQKLPTHEGSIQAAECGYQTDVGAIEAPERTKLWG